MKYSPLTLSGLLTLFLVCELFGLFIIESYARQESSLLASQQEVRAETGFAYFTLGIILVSAVFYMLMKLGRIKLIKAWFYLAIIIAITLSLSAFMPEAIAIMIAIIVLTLKVKEPNVYTHNMAELLIYAGIIILFVGFFDILSVIILLLVISVYDFVSVFITKHMIRMAKTQASLGMFSGLLIKRGEELAMLGGGDVAFSLLFASVIALNLGFGSGILCILGAGFGLFLLMLFGSRGRFYPAMPLISFGSLLGLLISII